MRRPTPLHDAAAKVAAARRADLDAALKQMKADASEAEARLQKLKQAGSESWTVFGAALAESRKAFDRANQAAWDALKRAAASSDVKRGSSWRFERRPSCLWML